MRDFMRQCNVYYSQNADRVIVASTYNHGGLFAEKPRGAVLLTRAGLVKLEEVIRQALSTCEYITDFDYSSYKRSDWPAFKASGEAVIRSFEANFSCFIVCGSNEKNLWYKISSPPFGDFELHLEALANSHNQNLSNALDYIRERYFDVRGSL